MNVWCTKINIGDTVLHDFGDISIFALFCKITVVGVDDVAPQRTALPDVELLE